MYAIINISGKQYKITPGEKIKIDYINKKNGESIPINDVLMIYNNSYIIGNPFIKNIKINAIIHNTGKYKKIKIFKKKRRKGYHKTLGHKQKFTELFIKSIDQM